MQEMNEGSRLLAEELSMPTPAEAVGLQPSATEGMTERLPAAETSFMATAQDTSEMMGIFPSIHEVHYEEMVPTEMSDATRKAQREEKRPEHTGRLDKEIYNGVVAPLMQRLHASVPRLGYTQREWNAYVRHLDAPMTYRGEGPLVERWMTAEPPEGCSYGDWTALVCSIEDEIEALEGESLLSFSGRRSPLPQQATPSMPDTLTMAEQSLLLPRQQDETSSAAGQRVSAAQWVRNPLQVKEETSSLSSSVTTPLDEQTIRNERVAHQRIHNSQIREKGEAGVPDQGIVFNEHNRPRDIRPGQGILRNDPVLTSGRSQDRRGDTPRDQRRAEGQSGGLPGGTPGGGGDGDDDSGSSHSEDEEDSGSEAPSDEE
jgi:hypothetical protein